MHLFTSHHLPRESKLLYFSLYTQNYHSLLCSYPFFISSVGVLLVRYFLLIFYIVGLYIIFSANVNHQNLDS